jgi:arsenate reductase-like glutaredoxin family protein
MDLSVRALLRQKGTPYDDLGLDNPALSGDDLLDAILRRSILMERPVVAMPLGGEALPPLRDCPRDPSARPG